MWVMSRREGQSVHIGDQITVTVQQIQGTTVTLRIDTPRGSRIIKGECERCEPEVANDEVDADGT